MGPLLPYSTLIDLDGMKLVMEFENKGELILNS